MGREWGVRERESDCGVHVCCVFEAGEEIRDLEKKKVFVWARQQWRQKLCISHSMTVLPEEWEMIMKPFCLSPSHDLHVPKYVQEVKPVISSQILREYIFSHVFLTQSSLLHNDFLLL